MGYELGSVPVLACQLDRFGAGAAGICDSAGPKEGLEQIHLRIALTLPVG